MASESFHLHVLFHLLSNVMMTKTDKHRLNNLHRLEKKKNPTPTAALIFKRHTNHELLVRGTSTKTRETLNHSSGNFRNN